MAMSEREVACLVRDLNRPGAPFIDALGDLAALPNSPRGMAIREQVLQQKGTKPIVQALQHADIKVNCKAAHVLGVLAMSPTAAEHLITGPDAEALLSSLTAMLRSRSFWAQADALSCLGWLVGAAQQAHPTAAADLLAPLAPLVVRALSSHLALTATADAAEPAVVERDDNLRVYALAFLLKLHAARPQLLTQWLAPPPPSPPPAAESGSGDLVALLVPLAAAAHTTRGTSLPLALRLLLLVAAHPDGRRQLLARRCVPELARLRHALQAEEAATSPAEQPAAAAGAGGGAAAAGAGGGGGGEQEAEAEAAAAAGPQSVVVAAVLEALVQRPCR